MSTRRNIAVGLSELVHTLGLIHRVKDGMQIICSISWLEVNAFKVGLLPKTLSEMKGKVDNKPRRSRKLLPNLQQL